MKSLIGIEITRHSTFIKRVLNEFNRDVLIKISMEFYSLNSVKIYHEEDIPELLRYWCINKNLQRTTFFNLKQNEEELFGFWDSPVNMWADISVLSFIERISAEKIIRFNIVKKEPFFLFSWLNKMTRKKNI
jgi:hypothetical protein